MLWLIQRPGLPQHTTLHYTGDRKFLVVRPGDVGSETPDIPCSSPRVAGTWVCGETDRKHGQRSWCTAGPAVTDLHGRLRKAPSCTRSETGSRWWATVGDADSRLNFNQNSWVSTVSRKCCPITHTVWIVLDKFQSKASSAWNHIMPPRRDRSGSTSPGAQPPAQPSGEGHSTPRGGNCCPKVGRTRAGCPAGTVGTATKTGTAPTATAGLRSTTPPSRGRPHPQYRWRWAPLL